MRMSIQCNCAGMGGDNRGGRRLIPTWELHTQEVSKPNNGFADKSDFRELYFAMKNKVSARGIRAHAPIP